MFKLSLKSKNLLKGVNPKLVAVVERAIEISKVDFGVTEGLRTVETQRKYVATGKSRTMNSMHLTGHAVDLVAFVDGKVYKNIFELIEEKGNLKWLPEKA